ncbi:hypothetical protein NQ317_017580 [Molorchus minor]|uniref:Tyr recombinase domain-containing protein n=1 Tax=Molorchus minor TaxID=1323400 RepID=A0ABQ9JRZ9_9CUCU|nr:hypothetical protein NQ317_017580 [Molorchus minor]
MIKVGLILGIAGACRTDELVNLTVDDIEDVGSSLIVKIPNTKTKITRIFVVTDVGNMLELFRKYLALRPPHVKHKRLFCTTKQENPVGKNTMEKIPSVVASYLKLPDVACYTGHCLRRSSETLLADAGVDITTIKRHAGWKSTTVAEGYVENSIENKTKIANQVLVGTTTSPITKTVNVSESNIPSNINFENCTNCMHEPHEKPNLLISFADERNNFNKLVKWCIKAVFYQIIAIRSATKETVFVETHGVVYKIVTSSSLTATAGPTTPFNINQLVI